MGVSKNIGTPKSSILIGFSIINHPFWGTTIFGNIHILVAYKTPGPKSLKGLKDFSIGGSGFVKGSFFWCSEWDLVFKMTDSREIWIWTFVPEPFDRDTPSSIPKFNHLWVYFVRFFPTCPAVYKGVLKCFHGIERGYQQGYGQRKVFDLFSWDGQNPSWLFWYRGRTTSSDKTDP